MNLTLYTLLFLTAIVGTAILTYAGASGSVGSVRVPARAGIIIAAAMVVVWGLVGINAYEITIFSGDQVHTESYPQLGWVAIAGGAVAMFHLVQASIEEIEQTGGI
jgi:hypothetical protein